MKTFVCKRCGYIAFGEPPQNCPICNAPKQDFELDPNAIKKPADPKNLSELEKKHIPLIEIKRQCGLVGSGCLDANIKIGEIIHPMEAKHYIMYIDLYLDYNFICRYHLTPEKLNPALGIHLKVGAGKLLALENCNLHGRWMAEKEI
ncbi:MAG: desulfoferrodoxin [Candidatus Omnitrophica bacterium]|nr:desulfoferrodoxin [Candidatus Omnitrophota bacterium]